MPGQPTGERLAGIGGARGGDHGLRVVVNGGGRVLEGDTSDNSLTRTVTCV